MNNFFRELQRRNVIKAAITYAVVAWATLQVFDIIFPILGVPNSVLRYVLFGLIVGFPLWLIFSYVFEWTPEGFKKTDDVPLEASVKKRTGKKLNTLIIAGLSLAVVLLVLDRFVGFGMAPAEEKKSIAVLPFENLSGAEDAYFATGVTEDILTHISKIGDLRVLSRFTVRDYDMKGKTVQQVGSELGVGFLLTGSIRKDGEQIRISCQLVQVNPEQETWAENFDKKMDDVFAIQSNVAQQVALNLKAKLTPAEKTLIEKKPTTSLEAYNLYLQANNFQYMGSDENEKAVALYKKALELDPDFYQARTRLVTAYSRSISEYGVRGRLFYDTTFQMAKQLYELHPDAEETNALLGFQYLVKLDYVNAQKYLAAALEINPNNPQALNAMGMLARNDGKMDEAIRYFRKAQGFEPLRLNVYNFNIASCYQFLQMPKEALPYYQSVLDTKKSVNITLHMIGKVYADAGDKKMVRQMIDRLLANETMTLNLNKATSLAHYAQLDDTTIQRYVNRTFNRPDFNYADHSQTVIAKAYQLRKSGKGDSVNLILQKSFDALYARHKEQDDIGTVFATYAEIELIRDDKVKALAWMKRIMEKENLYAYYLIKTNHVFKAIENDPDFRDWMMKMEAKADAKRRDLSAKSSRRTL